MNIKKENRIALISAFIILFIFTLILLFLNEKTSTYKKLTIGNEDVCENNDINVSISQRKGDNGTWVKTSQDNITTFYGVTYDVTVKNISPKELNKWSLKFKVNEDIILNTAWNGTVEVHQSDKDAVQKLDLRNYESDKITLNHFIDNGDLLIFLNKDDYFIYYPSENTNEVPLSSGQKTVIGFNFYKVTDDYSVDFKNTEISYVLQKTYKNMPEFYALIGFVLFIVFFLFNYIITLQKNRSILKLLKAEELIVDETMKTFVGFIDAKDPYTAGHSSRVATYTKMLAEKMGYSEEKCREAYLCGLLHDAGKISIPENVLNKPGKLDDEEFELIKTHTTRGYEILRTLTSVKNADIAARYHHERYDGKGYPDKLKGEEIPEIARIICVADSYDAMNSNRIYRNALSKEKIINQLMTCSGTQFDSKIAELLLKLIDEGRI